MKIHSHIHELHTDEGIALYDLTKAIKNQLNNSSIKNGLVTISSRHTTTALTINEFESRLVDDVRQFLNRLVPPNEPYLHNDIHLRDCADDEPENAHSHILAMLLSSSEVIPVLDSELQLGTWQSVILVELDGPRQRQVTIQVIGE
ncbi:MAG: YjbQ family protein [Gammaproteobacteria bacterium]|nr:MAG: YjbQ family protein [Gammaproteobacteria bacterium]